VRCLQERQHTDPSLKAGDAVKASRRRLALLASVAAAVVAFDQVTKSLAESHLRNHSVHVIGPVWFRLAYNSGAAFSTARGMAPALAVLAVIAVVVIVFALRSASSKWMVLAGGLVTGGALGNLADRILRHNRGAVIDFIYTRFWPTFNVADSAITVGILILVASTLHRSKAARSDTREGTGRNGSSGG
jgi:signal peptidase II